MKAETKIAVFKGQKVRKILYQNEWWFSVIDAIEVVTDTERPRKYWSDLKTKLIKEGYSEVSEKIGQLKMPAPDGKMRDTDCANTETLFRIIQSIPSPKAEPFKRWLAKVGYERVQEIENPELATKRTRMLYKLKGYSDEWIEKRMRGIAIREELTDEWQNRGAQEEKNYEILTAQISKATFGVTPCEYKKLKGLERQNLRDHMNDLELIFTMLGERATTEIHRNEDSQGMKKLEKDAHAGGNIAGGARKALEKRLKRSVVSGHNYLKEKESQIRLKERNTRRISGV
ncbi:MAG: Bro-N domain-containing protein [Candidatus Omnitrophica bacterium]|jgi:hypothetical protein|nr:Bro-N domain-containing protein [Candidatus Omnitrophota bacterium]